MSKLVVTAAASPLFGNFILLVSASAESDGKPIKNLQPKNFRVHHLASLNHANPNERDVTAAKEGPGGFYTLTLEPKDYQPQLPPGNYVFAVAVEGSPGARPTGRGSTSGPAGNGQTIAVGNLPAYGQWKDA